MERRSFLKGMLIAASAATGEAMVKLAEPGEAAQLIKEQDVLLTQPHNPYTPFLQNTVYVKVDGVDMAIGVLKDFNVMGAMGQVYHTKKR